MCSSRVRAKIFPTGHLLLFLLATALFVEADNVVIPWMTGYFSSPFAFDLRIPENSDNLLATMNFDVTVGPISWVWNCDRDQCTGVGDATISGGSVGGRILVSNSTFFGNVSGGSYHEVEFMDTSTGYTIDSKDYNYDFAGLWTNGFQTSGNAQASIDTFGRPESFYTLTTYSPEPSTLALSGCGLASLYSRLRRTHRS